MRLLAIIFPCLILMSLSADLHAQARDDKDITPMHEFLKANADSTIIYRSNSNWFHTPEYFILSKKGDTLTAYSYQSFPAYDERIRLPEAIEIRLKKRIANIFFVPVDINQYFNPMFITQDSIRQFWDNVTMLKPWQIKDDAKEGAGCPVVKGKESWDVFDGGGVTLCLITKMGTKKISFYAPDFYEEQCPGRQGRKDILQIQKYFLSHFLHTAL